MDSEVIVYNDSMLGRTQRDRWVRFDCGVGNKEVWMVVTIALTYLQGSEHACMYVCVCVCVYLSEEHMWLEGSAWEQGRGDTSHFQILNVGRGAGENVEMDKS